MRVKRICMLLLLAGGLVSVAGGAEAPGSGKDDAARDTIAQINHLNWVVSKIKTYNNVLVLEDEYRQISPDRLNLNRIPDQATLQKIIAMLDLLHEMIGEERVMKEWRRTFEARRKRRQSDFWVEKSEMMANTVAKQSWTSSEDSAKAVLDISRAAVGAYRDYERMVEDLEDEALKQQFQVETKKLARLHELNKDILQSQWKMIQDYHFDDALRVSDSDILLFISALKDDDHERVYSRIEAMRDRFPIFPLYWYYLSSVALETGHAKVAMEACDTFFKVNRGLFRDDPTVGAVAMNKLFLMEKNEANKEEARKLLEIVWRHNAGDIDWRKDYFSAVLYASYLNDRPAAERALAHAISTLEVSVVDQLRELGKEAEPNSDRIDFADGGSLWMCRKLLDDIAKGHATYDEAGLKNLCARETTSNIEKLNYLGNMAEPPLWSTLGEDIEGIALEVRNRISWRKKGLDSEVAAILPLRWLLAGELAPKLELLRNDALVASFQENRSKRHLTKDRTVGIVFDVSRDQLAGVDSVRLRFRNSECPIVLTYASGTPFIGGGKAAPPGLLGKDGRFNADHALDDLRLMVATFRGKNYYRDGKDAAFSVAENPESLWKAPFTAAFPHLRKFVPGTIPVSVNGVESVVCSPEGAVQIKYRNRTEKNVRPAVSVYLLNRYGVVLARIDDIWSIKRLKPGETATSKFFEGTPQAYYIDIETAE